MNAVAAVIARQYGLGVLKAALQPPEPPSPLIAGWGAGPDAEAGQRAMMELAGGMLAAG